MIIISMVTSINIDISSVDCVFIIISTIIISIIISTSINGISCMILNSISSIVVLCVV